MIRLLLADVMPLADTAAYQRLHDRLSPERRMAADSFKFIKDRRLSLGATALIDLGLRPFGLKEREVSYGRGAYGKPYFINAPHIHFNISHSSTKVAVAFSDMEVGCDIEAITDMDMSVAERFFCSEEYLAILTPDNPYGRNQAFFRYWTLKESYMKATGLGLSLPPESFSVHNGCSAVGDRLPDSGFVLKSLDTFAGYECAVCYRPEAGIPEVETVILR